ncbi:ROK family protein [Lapidilactobacillus gannanensis]|uniref:ROK family protein n=1 Tax=Lapidilactobacillus gannanensis TaxID=2486002 RepID=A0ABW4BQA5_9LACO|nr:ROK family protein [Lapidilactobacillus gannanensis]
MQHYIGIDVGGTTIKYGLVDHAGQIQAQGAVPTPLNKNDFLEQLTKIVTDYQTQATDLAGIGISMPGIIKNNGFLVTAGAVRSMIGVNLKAEMEQRTNLPTNVENDANAAAIAEHWLGAAQGIENYLCLVLGTGFGGGAIINNQLYRGAHGMAGEFGWMLTHDLDFTRDLEDASLNKSSAIVGGLCHTYTLAKQQLDPEFERLIDARVIFQAAAAGEKLAQMTLDKFYYDLATGILNLIVCYDPEVVLIGGGISANPTFIHDLNAALTDLELRHVSVSEVKDQTIAQIKPAKLMNNAGIIGAVYQAMQRQEA